MKRDGISDANDHEQTHLGFAQTEEMEVGVKDERVFRLSVSSTVDPKVEPDAQCDAGKRGGT